MKAELSSIVALAIALAPSMQTRPSPAVPAEPPPVIWELHAKTGQTGWGGLGCPSCVKAIDEFSQSVSGTNLNGVQLGGSCDLSFSYGSSDSATGSLQCFWDPSEFRSLHAVSANWSSQFSIETAYADVSVSAWIRAPGMSEYEYEVRYLGSWTADRLNYGGSLFASQSEIGFPNPTASSIGMGQTLEGTLMTTTETKVFDEYPGIVYSRARFPAVVGAEDTNETIRVEARSAQSCILLCPGSYINGNGLLAESITFNLDQGVPPVSNFAPAVFADSSYSRFPVGIPVTFVSSSFDPDDGQVVGSGIVYYNWSFHGSAPFGSSEANQVSFTPMDPGPFTVTLEVVDNEGMRSSITKTFSATDAVSWVDQGGGVPGSSGVPVYSGAGPLPEGGLVSVALSDAYPDSQAVLVLGNRAIGLKALGGVLVPAPDVLWAGFLTDSAGSISASFEIPAMIGFLSGVVSQFWILDPSTEFGLSASNGLMVR